MSISIGSTFLLQQQILASTPAETHEPSSGLAALADGRFDAAALNPQPLPPKASVLEALRSRFDAVALNPQPLPPKVHTYEDSGWSLRFHRFDAVALNPQPLPPKDPEPDLDAPRLSVVARLLRGQS